MSVQNKLANLIPVAIFLFVLFCLFFPSLQKEITGSHSSVSSSFLSPGNQITGTHSFSITAGSCIDLDDSSTWSNNITDYGNRSYLILDNVTLCTKTYGRNTTFELFIFNGSFTLDCNGSTIINELGLGKAVLSRFNNTKLQNCYFVNFFEGVNIYDINETILPGVTWNWTQNASPNMDVANVVVDYEGNYVIAGTENFTLIPTGDRWRIVKVSNSGSTIWNWTQDPSNGDDQAINIAVDSSENYIVVGYDNIPGNAQQRAVKITNDGKTVWNYTNNISGGSDGFSSVVIDVDENYVFGGYDSSPGNSEWYLAKINANGNILWSWTQNPSGGADWTMSVAVDQDGNYVLAGWDSLPGDREWRVVKLDSNRNVLWNFTQNPSGATDEAQSLAVDHEGNYIVAGYDNDGGNDQIRVIKLDKNGNLLWNFTHNPSGSSDRALSVKIDIDGNYILSGLFNSSFGASGEWIVLKVMNNGSLMWNWTQNPSAGSFDEAKSIVVDQEGFYVAAGYDNLPGAGFLTEWRAVKLDPARIVSDAVLENVGVFVSNTANVFISMPNLSFTLNNFTLGHNLTVGKINYASVQSNNGSFFINSNLLVNPYFVSLNSSDPRVALLNSSANVTIDVNSTSCGYKLYKLKGFPQNKSVIISSGGRVVPDYTSCSGGILTFSTVDAFSGYAAKGNNPPVVSIIRPADNTQTTSTSIFFECNATDDVGLSNISLFVWDNNKNLILNQTNNASGAYNVTNWTVTLAIGSYVFNCRAEDNISQVDWDANRSLTINALPPEYNKGGGNSYFSGGAGVGPAVQPPATDQVERPTFVVTDIMNLQQEYGAAGESSDNAQSQEASQDMAVNVEERRSFESDLIQPVEPTAEKSLHRFNFAVFVSLLAIGFAVLLVIYVIVYYKKSSKKKYKK